MKRIEQLMVEFFDGTLDQRGSAELGRLLEQDRAALSLFIELYRIDRTMPVIFDGHLKEIFTPAVIEDIRKNERTFLGSVMTDVHKQAVHGRPVLRRRPTRTRQRIRRALRVFVRRAVAAAILLAAAWFLYTEHQALTPLDTGIAHVRTTSTDVIVYRAARGGVIAASEMALQPGDRIETRSAQAIEFSYPGEPTVFTLSENAAMSIRPDDPGRRLYVARGALDAVVAPQPQGRNLMVTTPHAECEVVGTRFIVTVDADSTTLDVREGSVLFRRLNADESLTVTTGHRAVATAATLALAPIPAPSPVEPAPQEVNADITISCDNEYILYLNGTEIARGDNWQNAQAYSVRLPRGRNVVAVRGTNVGGTASLLLDIRCGTLRLGTSRKWRFALAAPQGWERPEFDDRTWNAAFEHGKYGEGVWGQQVAGFPTDTPARWIWAFNTENTPIVYLRYDFEVSPDDEAGE